MSRCRRGAGRWAGAAVVAGLVAGSAPLAVARPAAPVESECADVSGDPGGAGHDDALATAEESAPLVEMGIDRATAELARQGRQPGQGVVVAVLDSGVSAASGIPVVEHVAVGVRRPPSDYHGTAVAGLIAGPPRPDGTPVGIAPAATILDVRVDDDPDAAAITDDAVLAGLDQVLDRMATLDIKVVTIALALPGEDDRIRQRITRITQRGAVVVAPTGNRPRPEEASTLPASFAMHRAGEDAASLAFPAAYRRVLAVSSSMTGMAPGTDPTAYVVESSRTMLAAPTAGGVSYSVAGGTCEISVPASSWAAAEVSGVLALLQSVYDEPPAQAVARLLATANGRTDVPNTLVGAGEVQAMEALTRPLSLSASGEVLSRGQVIDEPQQVTAPVEKPDPLASTRTATVWWGLLGGGLLMLAVLLRPVLARRRPPSSF